MLLAASMPVWLEWAFWICPMSYAEIGLSVNEFLAPRWQVQVNEGQTFHDCLLSSHSYNSVHM